MASVPNLIVSAVAEWNGKALNKGTTQISKFNKTVMGLGRTLGVTFSAAALLGYSKKAVAAFGEQIAEAKRLDTALRNLGFNFATAEAEGYIDSIEKVTGVNRDQLQPSFIELAQVTGSTTFAQNMLNTALDVSAGTGMDLASATKILSQAYVGNYKGLKQLNLGLTNTELASKSYLEVEKLIAEQYAGQSKNAADSYEGSLNRLKIAAEQASEQIGQALVSSLATSSGGMDKLIDKVDNAADSVAGLITNFGVLSKDLKDFFSDLPGAGVLENLFRGTRNYLGKLSIGNLRNLVDQVKGRQGGFPQGVPQDLKNLQANAEKSKMDKEALKRQKELIALQKKAQLAEKNKLSLSKAAAVFDTTRISIAAALQATYDKEELDYLTALGKKGGRKLDVAGTTKLDGRDVPLLVDKDTGEYFVATPGAPGTLTGVPSPAGASAPPTPAAKLGVASAATAAAPTKTGAGEAWKNYVGKTVAGEDIGLVPGSVYMPTTAGPGEPLKGSRTLSGDAAIRASQGTYGRGTVDETGKFTPFNEADRLPTLEEYQANLANVRNGLQREQTKVNQIKRLSAQLTPYTTGPIGSVMKFVPGSAALKVREALKTATSAIVLEKLRELKTQSSTGASGLGSVTEKELDLLATAVESLNQAQDAKTLKEATDRVAKHYEAALRAMQRDGQAVARQYQRVKNVIAPEPEAKARERVYNPKTGKFD